MDEKHVPPIGTRYWILFSIASIFGAHLGDVLPNMLPIDVWQRLLVQATLIAAVFIAEQRDRSSTELWYWIAVVLFQMTAVRLGDISTVNLGFDPLVMAGGLALLLVTTMVMARADDTHLYATMQLERPGTEGKPLADVAHWLGLIVASTLGAVAADLGSTVLGVGPVLVVTLLSIIVAALLHLQRRTRPDRLHAFWLTTVLVRSTGVAISDLMVKGPPFNLGLLLSTALSGCFMVGLLVLWPPSKSRRK